MSQSGIKRHVKYLAMVVTKTFTSILITTIFGSIPCLAQAGASQASDEFSLPGVPAGTNNADISTFGSGISWYAPSDGPYPILSTGTDLWIDASLSTQRIHIMDGQTILYTMITSSGFDHPDSYTPSGTYHIQNRGNWFYSEKYQEGAEYWVSWKGWGDYLFHSVPMNHEQQVIPGEAAQLGAKASHGCFRLTVSDAKWIYENVPEGTKVVIHD